MALPENHPLNEDEYGGYTSSLGATPVAAYVHAGKRGRVTKVGVIQSGAVTGTSTVTVSVSGTTIATISVTAGSAGSVFTAVPSSPAYVTEDSAIVFTPAGATGTVTGQVFAKVRS